MSRLELSRPAFCLDGEERERVRRLARHLHARMAELEEDGLEIRAFREEEGLVAIAVPEQENLAGRLRWEHGVHGAVKDGSVELWVTPATAFEDLDSVWGAVYEILSE